MNEEHTEVCQNSMEWISDDSVTINVTRVSLFYEIWNDLLANTWHIAMRCQENSFYSVYSFL